MASGEGMFGTLTSLHGEPRPAHISLQSDAAIPGETVSQHPRQKIPLAGHGNRFKGEAVKRCGAMPG